jgi:hypothetical protein
MILRRSNCGRRQYQNDVRNTKGKLLSANHQFRVVAAMAFIGIAIQCADNAYGATNDKLDVNLNVLYVGTKSQKDSNTLSEIIIQFPFPLTEGARETGQGFFGGITYYDNKTLVDANTQRLSDNPQLVTEKGFGRIYYSTSIPGDTAYTFVPYVTFFRQFLYGYVNKAGTYAEISGSSIMLPGFMYAYRFNEQYAFHFDGELYSYAHKSNNRSRIGFTYSPAWPWIISLSRERLGWDIDASDISVEGNSREYNLKLIFRDPPQGNFAFTIGYGNVSRNAEGSALLAPSATNRSGTYFGVEASGGVLAW